MPAALPNQIDMPPALINRFDLIFVMRDLPNKELDTNIATRVLESHAYKDPVPEIEGKLLRKYLAYVKQKVSMHLFVILFSHSGNVLHSNLRLILGRYGVVVFVEGLTTGMVFS